MKRTAVLWIAAAGLALAACRPVRPTRASAPPNEPARIELQDGAIRIEYAGTTVFQGSWTGPGNGLIGPGVNVYSAGGRIEQVVLLAAPGPGARIRISGTITGGEEAFPVEADRPEAGPLIVRHASGLSRSRLNRAVYDRGRDWVLSVDANPSVSISVLGEEKGARIFGLEAEGPEIVLRFRPRFFQKHKGLEFFEPWTYRLPAGSVAGWCSWFAFKDEVTEKDILETADVLSEVLLPFGYRILQIDDGYQSGEGLPDLWLNTNSKFPDGLAGLSRSIKAKGLTPGIWTNVAFKQQEYGEAHKGWFVTDGPGRLHTGNWVDLSLDGSVPAALDAVVRPVYRSLKESGWEYFKVDALRHLLYEGYNAGAGHFLRRGQDRVEAFRSYVSAIREEIGRDRFMLGCWGIRPELIGIIDGCRIGNDGFSYAGLAQYNSFNNVVWRNDPDHVELDRDAFRSTMVTSLSGSILLLTDKPSVYRTPAAEIAKRAAPVLETVPGQIYEVDPSRIETLWKAGEEVSGSGPRTFDAGASPRCDLYQLEIVRPFEDWVVLGRTGESQGTIRFRDLGLDPAKEYFVFEFWSKRLFGSFRESFIPGPLDPLFKCQALCVREKLDRPQVVATSRHVTCGGVDLVDVRWENGQLSGTSRLVAGDPYVLFITEPPGFRLAGFSGGAAGRAIVEKDGGLLKVALSPESSGEASWTADFAAIPQGGQR